MEASWKCLRAHPYINRTSRQELSGLTLVCSCNKRLRNLNFYSDLPRNKYPINQIFFSGRFVYYCAVPVLFFTSKYSAGNAY